MKILSMTATFGRLQNRYMELQPGLNVIHAPNEGGKSTWCAFWKTMLYGLDTRDRDKKGYLADKNHYQPWSGAPMEGEVRLEWQGRDITIRRAPRGSTPMGSFSAVYTGTGEAVPGLTGDNCGEVLTGVGREMFERSAFLGGASAALTPAPELERRIAALVSSGQEEVSFSQTHTRLKDWANRRRVNRSVGLIPKLEGELQQVEATLRDLEEVNSAIARLEAEQTARRRQLAHLEDQLQLHRRIRSRELNHRYAQAGEQLRQAREELDALEREAGRYGTLPERHLLKNAQGELEYLKALDDQLRQSEQAASQARQAREQTEQAARDDRFAGLSGEQALSRAQAAAQQRAQGQMRAAVHRVRGRVAQLFALLALVGCSVLRFTATGQKLGLSPIYALLLCAAGALGGCVYFFRAEKNLQKQGEALLAPYGAASGEELLELARDYARRQEDAARAGEHCHAVLQAREELHARRENTRSDLLSFVHTFAPQVTDLFGCSAALSRALGLEQELELCRARVEERQRRREDLAAQGGQDFDTLELIPQPELSQEDTQEQLGRTRVLLDQTVRELNQALGRQRAIGDSAALAARREELAEQLRQRQEEYDALVLAMATLEGANARLQERFSPELNRLAGAYLAQLTGGRYAELTLNREMEGFARREGDVLPHSALYLSRGTAEQLYLALRLAVCRLCLPEKPPLVLDDALAAFDDERLALALQLLRQLEEQQQILLFTCHTREQALLARMD